MEKNDSLKLENQLAFPIYLCSKEIIRKYTPYLNEVNLTYTQYIVMMCFWELKKTNIKELGKIILLDSSTLSPVFKNLEKKGYIKRVQSTKDGRYMDASLTPKGIKLRDKVTGIPNKISDVLDLTDEEINTMKNIARKILKNIQEDDVNV